MPKWLGQGIHGGATSRTQASPPRDISAVEFSVLESPGNPNCCILERKCLLLSGLLRFPRPSPALSKKGWQCCSACRSGSGHLCFGSQRLTNPLIGSRASVFSSPRLRVAGPVLPVQVASTSWPPPVLYASLLWALGHRIVLSESPPWPCVLSLKVPSVIASPASCDFFSSSFCC